jgi:hypothetical protein
MKEPTKEEIINELKKADRCWYCSRWGLGKQYIDATLRLIESQPEKIEWSQIHCSNCGQAVSSKVPKGTVVRAWIECEDCVKKEKDESQPEVDEKFINDWSSKLIFLPLGATEHWTKAMPKQLKQMLQEIPVRIKEK